MDLTGARLNRATDLDRRARERVCSLARVLLAFSPSAWHADYVVMGRIFVTKMRWNSLKKIMISTFTSE